MAVKKAPKKFVGVDVPIVILDKIDKEATDTYSNRSAVIVRVLADYVKDK